MINDESGCLALKLYKSEFWNPFVRSLPKKMSKSELFNEIRNEPSFAISEKMDELYTKNHYINRLNDLFIPVQSHFDVYEYLYDQIEKGYLNRYSNIGDYYSSLRKLGPLKKMYEKFKGLETFESIVQNSNGEMVSIVKGIEGNGKSEMFERLLLTFPQVVRHRRYEDLPFIKTQIIWIKIDYPFDGTLKTFCVNVFKYFDNILGSCFVDKFGHSKNTSALMFLYVSHLLSLYSVGLMVVDNIDEFNLATGANCNLLSNIAKLSYISNVPIIKVVSTVPEEIKLLEGETKLIEDGFMFSTFSSPSEFKRFLEIVFKYQWMLLDCEVEEEYKTLMMNMSHVPVRKIIGIHRCVQEEILSIGIEPKINDVIELIENLSYYINEVNVS